MTRFGCSRMNSGARILTTSLFAAALVGADGKKVFNERCAGCHGEDARGGGKGPGLAGSPRLSGMPAFNHVLTDTQMWQVTLLLANADKPLPPAALDLLHPDAPAAAVAPVPVKAK